MAEKLMKPEEVAARLDVDPETVRIWLRKGRLPASKIGHFWRVSEAQLQEFLQETSTRNGER